MWHKQLECLLVLWNAYNLRRENKSAMLSEFNTPNKKDKERRK